MNIDIGAERVKYIGNRAVVTYMETGKSSTLF